MSRITRKKNTSLSAPKQNTEDVAMQEEEEDSHLNFTENKTNDEHIARVVFEANATADQLSRGHIVRLANAKKIFETDNDVDFTKGIITGIKTCSVYSDCSESVTCLSIFLIHRNNNRMYKTNKAGSMLHNIPISVQEQPLVIIKDSKIF